MLRRCNLEFRSDCFDKLYGESCGMRWTLFVLGQCKSFARKKVGFWKRFKKANRARVLSVLNLASFFFSSRTVWHGSTVIMRHKHTMHNIVEPLSCWPIILAKRHSPLLYWSSPQLHCCSSARWGAYIRASYQLKVSALIKVCKNLWQIFNISSFFITKFFVFWIQFFGHWTCWWKKQ